MHAPAQGASNHSAGPGGGGSAAGGVGDSNYAASEAASALGLGERPFLLALDQGANSLYNRPGSNGAMDAPPLRPAGPPPQVAQQPRGLGSGGTPFGVQDIQVAISPRAGLARAHTGGFGGVPGVAVHEESVHRKVLALMALEAKAGATATGGAAADADAPSARNDAAFSVTEYVRAATLQHAASASAVAAEEEAAVAATTPTGAGAAAQGLTPLQLLRSMSLALQQQQQDGLGSTGSGGSATSPVLQVQVQGARPALRGGQPPATLMTTISEHKRMSLDTQPPVLAAAAQKVSAPSGRSRAAGGALPPIEQGSQKGTPASALQPVKRSESRRQRIVEATARMADATRQVWLAGDIAAACPAASR